MTAASSAAWRRGNAAAAGSLIAVVESAGDPGATPITNTRGDGTIVMNDEPSLLPCPFCGGAVKFRQALWPAEGDSDAVIHAASTDCPMAVFNNDTADQSIIERWNTRAERALRSIATAPKDGTWILGWARQDSAPYRISWGRNHNGILAWCSAAGSFVPGYITDWMPLPNSPSDGGEQCDREAERSRSGSFGRASEADRRGCLDLRRVG